jgi:hypothetical protein
VGQPGLKIKDDGIGAGPRLSGLIVDDESSLILGCRAFMAHIHEATSFLKLLYDT